MFRALTQKLALEWVDGVKYWHRIWSIRMAILSTLLGIATSVLPTWQPAIPPLPFAIATTVCAALTGLSRLIKQLGLLAQIATETPPDTHQDRYGASEKSLFSAVLCSVCDSRHKRSCG